jgi:hypothetical protein
LENTSIFIIFTTTLLTNTNQSSYFAQELDKKQQIQMLELLNSFYILQFCLVLRFNCVFEYFYFLYQTKIIFFYIYGLKNHKIELKLQIYAWNYKKFFTDKKSQIMLRNEFAIPLNK